MKLSPPATPLGASGAGEGRMLLLAPGDQVGDQRTTWPRIGSQPIWFSSLAAPRGPCKLAVRHVEVGRGGRIDLTTSTGVVS